MMSHQDESQRAVRASRRAARRMWIGAGALTALLAAVVASAQDGSSAPQAPPSAPDGGAPRAPAPSQKDDDARGGSDARSQPRSLFNGRSLEGWRVFVPDNADASKTFTVRDGVLVCSGAPAGYIATTDEFESFELELEWRFDAEKGAGNSGVLLRVDEKDQVWPRSIEAQLHSGNAGDIWNIGEVPMKADPSRTEGRRTRKMASSSEKPLGEWNRYRITLDGGKLELRVNGVLQNEAEECEVRKGRIALQSEGAYIEFRNISIRPIGGKR